MDIIEPALYYLQQKGFAVTRERLEKIENKLRRLSVKQNEFIEKNIEIYYSYLIILEEKVIVFNPKMAWMYSEFIKNGIYCKLNKDQELIVHLKRLNPVFPDEIVTEYLRKYFTPKRRLDFGVPSWEVKKIRGC